jgi:putative membrane protein
MDYAFDFLLVCHLVALGVGAATAIAMPIIGSRMAGATPEGRAMLGGISARLGLNSRIAVGVLVLSGGLMVWLRYGGIDGMNMWFWVKMTLVVVIILALITSAVGRGRVNPAVLGWVTRLSLLGVVIAAVLAFN